MIQYGEIKNMNEGRPDRELDMGHNKDGFLFVFTPDGWKPLNEDKLAAHYWRQKYLELKSQTEEE
jgi:hypothetical protein